MSDFGELSDFSTSFPSEKYNQSPVQIETESSSWLRAEFEQGDPEELPGETKSLAVETTVPASFSAMHLNSPESSGNASAIIKVHTSSGKGREST